MVRCVELFLKPPPEDAAGEDVESCWAIMTEKKFLWLERSWEVVSKLTFGVWEGRTEKLM